MPIMANTFINDYVSLDSRGKGFAIQNLGLQVGALFSTGVLFRFTKELDPKYTYIIAGVYGIISSFIILYFVSEPTDQSIVD